MRAKLVSIFGPLLAVVASGCSLGKSAEKTYEPMGSDAPSFGAANMTTVEAFLPGKWCICDINNEEFSKQLGVQDITPDDVNTTIVYDFAPDGKFTVNNTEAKWRVDGKWEKVSDAIALHYEKVDGLDWNQAEMELQKKEESGRQAGIVTAFVYEAVFKDLPKLNRLYLAGDKKRLSFNASTIQNPLGSGSGEIPIASVTSKGLVRMKEKKS